MRFKIIKLGAFSFLDYESAGCTFNTLSDFFSTATRPGSLFKAKRKQNQTKSFMFQEQRLYRETSNAIRATLTLHKLTTAVYKHPVLLLTPSLNHCAVIRFNSMSHFTQRQLHFSRSRSTAQTQAYTHGCRSAQAGGAGSPEN